MSGLVISASMQNFAAHSHVVCSFPAVPEFHPPREALIW